ncbi:MAG: NAD-dependent epimerase/dehydratase family protein [Polyangia bacterium]
MKILVTGGTGFLGSAIVRRLEERGDEVRVLSRSAGGDVADEAVVQAAVRGCDAVFHTAARVGSWGRPADFHRTNVIGTQNVIDACVRHGIARLVYTSSPSVVSSDGDLEGVDESHPSGPYLAEYPRTKALAEALVLAASSATLTTVALRPHLMFGPGDTQLVPRLVDKAKAGRVVLPSGPDKLVDCTYIDNAVDAHLLALSSTRCKGRAYFISQGEPVPSRWLVDRVLGCAGLPPVRRRFSPSLLYALGAMCETTYRLLRIYDREPPITRFVAHELCTAHWFDLSAARRDLGYAPRINLEDGLSRLAASMK